MEARRWEAGMSEAYTLMHVPARLVPTIQGIAKGTLVAVPHHRHMTDEMAEVIAGKANCCGGIAYDIYRAVIEHQIAAAQEAPR
jgi:hypothetical protein